MLVQLPFYMPTEPNAETTDEKTASNNSTKSELIWNPI